MAKRRTHSSGIVTIKGALDDLLTSVNTYVDAGTIETQFLKTLRIHLSAATNDLACQILGSLDDGATFDVTVVSEFTITAGTPVIQTITDYLTDIKVQVKPNVADAHGTLSTKYVGASL